MNSARARVAVSLLLTAALLMWVFSNVELQAIATTLRELELRTVLVAAGALLATYVLRALRLFEELHLESGVRVRDCLRIVLLHNMSVNVVPFRAGEAALPLLLASELRIPLRRGIVTLAWLRAQDATIVATIALLAWPDIEWPLRVLGIVVLVATLTGALRWARTGRETAAGSGRWREALRRATSSSWRTWLWCGTNWALKLATITWLLQQLTQLSGMAAATAALGGEAAAFLPVQGVAGFGTYEAGVALGASVAMPASAINLANLLAAALAVHLVVIASAVMAGAIALLLPRAPTVASAASAGSSAQ